MPCQSVGSLLRLPKRKRLEIAESRKKVLDGRLADYRSRKSEPVSHGELMRRLGAP